MGSLLGYVATGVVSLVVGILLTYLQPRAKLVYWSPHSFLFNLAQQNVVLQTDALTVQNLGRQTAENVEVVFDGQPDFFQFSPSLPFVQETTNQGHFVLRVATLGRNEFFTLQVLSYTKVPQVLNVRSNAGQGQFMQFQIQRVYPTWFNLLAVVLLIVGFGFSCFWLIKALVFISGAMGIA